MQSSAHMTSNQNRIFASNATLQFITQDKAASTQWNAVDDNEKCSKEAVIALSGKLYILYYILFLPNLSS